MRPYWGDVCNVLRVLAYMVKGSDDDGMDLYFTISSIKHNSKKATGLHNQIRGKQLQGTSDIGLRLSIILDDYKASLRQPTPKRLSFLGRAKRRVRKGLSVYILTDAVWQPHSDAGQPIESLVRTLVELDSPQKQVGIQFIRFGNDPESIEKLRHLDSGLHLERYGIGRRCHEAIQRWKRLTNSAGTSLMQSRQKVMSGRCSWVRLINGLTVTKRKTTERRHTERRHTDTELTP